MKFTEIIDDLGTCSQGEEDRPWPGQTQTTATPVKNLRNTHIRSPRSGAVPLTRRTILQVFDYDTIQTTDNVLFKI